ncbi:MAG: hypothetical protein ACK40O_01025 [Allosphingosinicella sp.]
MSRPLTLAMEIALLQLHIGWHFGVDGRTERALLRRGLIRLGWYNRTFPSLPFLSDAGRAEAKRLWLRWPIEEKRALREVLHRWGLAA